MNYDLETALALQRLADVAEWFKTAAIIYVIVWFFAAVASAK